MADKLNAASANKKLDKTALKRVVADINKQKEKASEYAGLAGKATATACEQHNFDKKALTFCAQLARKEPAQQLATLGAIISYAEALGMFAQMDMFNDAIPAMQAVIDNAKTGAAKAPSPGADNLAKLAAMQ